MIWCVEDDESIRDIEIYALHSAGFETRGFEDGLSFWEALKKEKPQLIVLDVMLPGMDGMFLTHPGMVYTREQLFSQVWKLDYMGDSRTLDAHIRTLRQKLEQYPSVCHFNRTDDL